MNESGAGAFPFRLFQSSPPEPLHAIASASLLSWRSVSLAAEAAGIPRLPCGVKRAATNLAASAQTLALHGSVVCEWQSMALQVTPSMHGSMTLTSDLARIT